MILFSQVFCLFHENLFKQFYFILDIKGAIEYKEGMDNTENVNTNNTDKSNKIQSEPEKIKESERSEKADNDMEKRRKGEETEPKEKGSERMIAKEESFSTPRE